MCPKSFKTKTIALAGVAAILALIALGASSPAYATGKKVNQKTAGDLLTMCALTEDHYPAVSDPKTEGWEGCCSTSLGYCIECPVGNVTKCIKFPAKKVRAHTRPPAPNNGGMAPAANTIDRPGKARGGVAKQ